MSNEIITNRLKIKTHLPLTPFQAWIPFNPEQSIQSLKNSILNLIQSSQQPINPISIQDIILELDVFALHDPSVPWSIDPNLVSPQTIDPGPTILLGQSSQKRSRSPSEINLNSCASHTQLIMDSSPNQYPSQSCQLPRSEMETHLTKSSFNPSLGSNVPAMKQALFKPFVPHGQGKASTKANNQRRKRKKIRERERNQLGAGEMIQLDSELGSSRLFSSCSDYSFPISHHKSNSLESLDDTHHHVQDDCSDFDQPTGASSNSPTHPMVESSNLTFLSNPLTKPESASFTSSSFLNTLSAYIGKV